MFLPPDRVWSKNAFWPTWAIRLSVVPPVPVPLAAEAGRAAAPAPRGLFADEPPPLPPPQAVSASSAASRPSRENLRIDISKFRRPSYSHAVRAGRRANETDA